ncbi:MAG: hypothetical protein IKU10_08285 [Clostridia bacterium]|nr:hypothetical protein [Clostridia bacterium]
MTLPIADYTFLQNTTWRLKAVYPFLRVKTIGKSVVGRSIYGLEIGRESAPCTILVGTFWGTDRFSGPLLLQFAERVLHALANHTSLCEVEASLLLQNHRIVCIPFINPDGREICEKGAHCAGLDSGKIRRLCGGDTALWNTNARGVDIGRNVDFGFSARRKREKENGLFGPASFGYSGPSPESEPETVALSNYCRQQKVRQAIAFYPGSGEIYWRNRPEEQPEAQQLGELLALTAGYRAEAAIGPMTDSGFRNWMANTTRAFSMDCMVQHRTLTAESYQLLEEMLVVACLSGQ